MMVSSVGMSSRNFVRIKKIKRQKTTSYKPQHDRVTKRMNRMFMEKGRSILIGAKLGESFWVEAVDTTCYSVNRSLTSSFIDKNIHEVWSGKKLSLKHLKFFGCDAYVHVSKEKWSKLDSKFEKCIYHWL